MRSATVFADDRPTRGGGQLVIGGGGSVAVATGTLFAHAAQLDDLARDLDGCSRTVAVIDRAVSSGVLGMVQAPPSVMRAELAMDEAVRAIADAGRASSWLATALRTSAEVYGRAEDAAGRVVQSFAAQVGYALGFAGTAVGLAMLPYVLGGAAVIGSGYLLARALDPTGTRRAMTDLGHLIDTHRGVLSDPALVELVRLTVTSSDDMLGGALHLPPALMRSLGDEGLGITGPDTVAIGLLGLGATAGMLRETPVSVRGGAPAAVTPATGFADRADRIPEGTARIRVDRYVMPDGADRFEVYLAGTTDFDPRSSGDPFDMTSNVAGLAGGDPGAYRAVEAALADAGATSESQIVITGHSQGGLIASQLASSGDYRVAQLYTLGAPAGQVAVPESVPWVAVEHTDDVVPALGGTWAGADPLLVRREAFADGPPVSDHTFPAHLLGEYRGTAAMADQAEEGRLIAARERLDDFGSGAVRVESTLYEAERVARVPR